MSLLSFLKGLVHLGNLLRERDEARAALASAEADRDTLRLRLDDSLKECDRLRQENDALGKSIAQMEERLKEAQESLEGSRREVQRLRRANTELRERQDEIEELKAMVPEVEKMRASFELRIRNLRHALREARALLADREDYDDLRQMTVIDNFTTPGNPRDTAGNHVGDTAAGKRNATSTPKPKNRESGKNDNDWLMPLPD